MESNKKLINILEASIMIALGVLIAIFGIGAVDLYFGIVFLVTAAVALAAIIVGLAKYKLLVFGLIFAFCACLVFGIALLTHYLSLGVLVDILVFLVIAMGGALIFYGTFVLVKVNVFFGLGQIVLGALAVTAGILYLFVPEFRVAFWIIVGVLVALYGVVLLVAAIANKQIGTQKA